MGWDIPESQVIKQEEHRLECGCITSEEWVNLGHSKTLGRDNLGWSKSFSYCDKHGYKRLER